jgi:hypothetical protein
MRQLNRTVHDLQANIIININISNSIVRLTLQWRELSHHSSSLAVINQHQRLPFPILQSCYPASWRRCDVFKNSAL